MATKNTKTTKTTKNKQTEGKSKVKHTVQHKAKKIMANTDINDVIATIYDTNWDYANQFDITINLPSGAGVVAGLHVLDSHLMFNTAIKTFTVPDYTTSPIETYVGGSWTYTNGIKEIQKIDMTLRDFNDFYLHRSFTALLDNLRDMFPAEQYWGITIRASKGGTIIYQTTHAILDSVSNISLDRTNESQIAEFSVSFKSR